MKNITILSKKLVWLVMAVALLGPLAVSLLVVRQAVAATYLTHTMLMEFNMVASGNSQLAIAFTTASAGATSVTINFGSWGGTVNTTQTVTTTGCVALTGASTGLPGSITASGSGNVITISSVTALSASTSYCAILNSASAVTNPSSTGVYSVTITAGSDSATVAIDVISNDQYTVSATVAPTFTLSLSASTDSLGTLSSSALTTSTGVTATVSTNAGSGWFVWAEDSQAGLRSATQNHTIPTVSTGSNHTMNGGTIGTEAYALGVTSGNATANYADSGGVTGGGLSTSTFNEIATATSPGSSVAVTLKELADISSTTPSASDYTDIITIVGAGSF